MDESRKRDYRYLLYAATLDIRAIRWMHLGPRGFLNPFRWRWNVAYVRRAGVIADCFHNLAFFCAYDFEGFDEAWFWREFEGYCKKYPEYEFWRYKNHFDRVLSEEGAAK